MFPMYSIGPAELVILSGVTGMACGALLIGAVAIAVLVFRRRTEPQVKEE